MKFSQKMIDNFSPPTQHGLGFLVPNVATSHRNRKSAFQLTDQVVFSDGFDKKQLEGKVEKI